MMCDTHGGGDTGNKIGAKGMTSLAGNLHHVKGVSSLNVCGT